MEIVHNNSMRKIFIVLTILLISANWCEAKHLYLEKDYQCHWCNAKGGQMEYVLNDKARIDCLLPDKAVEVDFAAKWAECIGQALYYGNMTNKTPACLLIMENGAKDNKYLYRLINATKDIKDFRIFTITPDDLKNISRKYY